MWKTSYNNRWTYSVAANDIPSASFQLFRGSPTKGNAFAIERSVTRSVHLHDIWPFFVPLCNELQKLCRWSSLRSPSKIIMHNLIQKKLRCRWIFKATSKNICFMDDFIKKDDVVWGKRERDDFSVGRVLFIIRIEGLKNIVNIKGKRLHVGLRIPNGCVFVGTNVWKDQMRHGEKRGDLRKYWRSLPVFREIPTQFSLWMINQVFQKLAYRHAHVAMPEKIWEVVWRKGMKDMRHRGGTAHSNWCKLNKHPYLWGLSVGKKSNRNVNYWCGVREICLKHKKKECISCFKNGLATKKVVLCLKDYRWVILGIWQGNNNKFTSTSNP